MLSDKQIETFQAVYKTKFGKEISREEAYEKGSKLINLIKLAYRPMTNRQSSTDSHNPN